MDQPCSILIRVHFAVDHGLTWTQVTVGQLRSGRNHLFLSPGVQMRAVPRLFAQRQNFSNSLLCVHVMILNLVVLTHYAGSVLSHKRQLVFKVILCFLDCFLCVIFVISSSSLVYFQSCLSVSDLYSMKRILVQHVQKIKTLHIFVER